MQELQLINLKENCNGRVIDFQVKEKRYGRFYCV